jgi:ElaB/YqjD/DUF883 family membrane-anchored ribosome-binding protein
MTESATTAVREYTEPVLIAVEENLRDIRRAVVAGRHAVEDSAAEANIQVRRHPFVSLGIAAGVGTLFGCLMGFTIARVGSRRMSR